LKIIGRITMADIIEECFGEIDPDMVELPRGIRWLGHVAVNTDHDKVEAYYDRSHEWIVPYSRLVDGEDE